MKRGFVFVETMVVIAFLGTILLSVYAAFTSVIDSAKTRLYYDDPVYLYRTYYILNFLEENGLTDYINLTFDNATHIGQISCLNPILMAGEDDTNDNRNFCSTTFSKWNVNNVFIMKYNVSEIVKCVDSVDQLTSREIGDCNRNYPLSNLSMQAVNYLYSLDGYTGVYDENIDETAHYRIVVEFKVDTDKTVDYYDYFCDDANCDEKKHATIQTSKYYYTTLEVPYGSSRLLDENVICKDTSRAIMQSYNEGFGALLDQYRDPETTGKHLRKIVINEVTNFNQATGTGAVDISKHANGKVKAIYKAADETLYIEYIKNNKGGLIACSGERLFYGLPELESIVNLPLLNTQYMTTMSAMFQNDLALKSLNLSNFNTKNVTDMSSMFRGCIVLGSGSDGKLYLTSFDTSNVTTMSHMFAGISARDPNDPSNGNYSSDYYMNGLEEIIFGEKFNTSKVTNMSLMFYNDLKLLKVNVENFNTSNVTTMSWMFANCQKLTSLDLSKWNTKKVTTFKRMFMGCKAITSIKFGPDFTINEKKDVNMEGMFASCNKIPTLNLNSFNNFESTKTVRINANASARKDPDTGEYMKNAYRPQEIELWANGMFAWTNQLTTIYMENFDFTKIREASDVKAEVGETIYENNEFMGKNLPKINNSPQYQVWEELRRNKGMIFYRSPWTNESTNPATVNVYVRDCTQKCRLKCYVANQMGYSGIDNKQTSRINIINKTGGTCSCSASSCPAEFDDYTADD